MSPTILAISTSSAQGLVALQTPPGDISEQTQFEQKEHNQFILPAIDTLLKKAKLMLTDIDYFAACVGPGSFVGTRLAVAVTQGLAFGAHKPVVPISFLALLSLATNLPEVTVDARMQALYRLKDGRETFERFTTDVNPTFTEIPIFTGPQLIQLANAEITKDKALTDPVLLQPTYLQDEGNWRKI